jgi:hypothetical protein
MSPTWIAGVALTLISGVMELGCGSPKNVTCPCRVDFPDGGCGYYEVPYCVCETKNADAYCRARGGIPVEGDAGTCVSRGFLGGCN